MTVGKIEIKWDKKKKLTVRIAGTPASNSNTNVIDLSGKDDGTVIGNIGTFDLIFNNTGAGLGEGQSLAYTGKKKTTTVIKDKASGKTFTLVDWSVKGKK